MQMPQTMKNSMVEDKSPIGITFGNMNVDIFDNKEVLYESYERITLISMENERIPFFFMSNRTQHESNTRLSRKYSFSCPNERKRNRFLWWSFQNEKDLKGFLSCSFQNGRE